MLKCSGPWVCWCLSVILLTTQMRICLSITQGGNTKGSVPLCGGVNCRLLREEAIVWFLLLKTPEAMLPSLRCILATMRSH